MKRTSRYRTITGLTFLMDMITQVMNIFNGVYVDDRGWKHYRVQGKTYDIRFHPMTLEWECSCPLTSSEEVEKYCKHIKEIQNNKK